MACKEIIFYKNNQIEKIEKIEKLTSESLEMCHGMKIKCYLKDDTLKIGYVDVYCTNDDNHYDGTVHEMIELHTYENLTRPISYPYNDLSTYKQIFEKIEIDKIIKVEALLYSNPRWGGTVTNEFNIGG